MSWLTDLFGGKGGLTDDEQNDYIVSDDGQGAKGTDWAEVFDKAMQIFGDDVNQVIQNGMYCMLRLMLF